MWAARWLEVYKQDNVSDITFENTYQNPVVNHITPYFKNAKIAEIKEIDVRSFYNSKTHYSQSVLNKIRVALNAIMESAIKNQIISNNPAKGVTAISKQEKSEKRAYTGAQATIVIEFAKNHPDGLPVVMMLKTGLRRSELFALKWSAIDFGQNIISVKQSIAESKYGMQIGPPKTKASMADIPMDTELKQLLYKLPRSISGFVLPNTKGKMMSPANWAKRNYKRFMSSLVNEHPDLPVLTPHELRHTFGSLVYEATKDIYITSKLMRHANIDITAKIYVHESLDNKRDAINLAFKFNNL